MHYRRTLILFFLLAGSLVKVSAQVYENAFIKQALDTMEPLSDKVKILENFGVKEIGTMALEQTGLWLDSFYQALGFETKKDSFRHLGYDLFNLIAEKHSTQASAPWLIIIAHYDTKNGAGANDNGSGVAATMEIGRHMSSISELRANIRIIHFSAEEYNLAGSRHYVGNQTTADTNSVLLVFNLDQLGGSKGGENNDKINCERDEDAPAGNNERSWRYTDTLAQIVSRYTLLTPVVSRAFGSDYVPFQQNDYTINGLYQFSSYPFYHTTGDLLEQMDTFWLQEAGKAALAYCLYLGGSVQHKLGYLSSQSRNTYGTVFPNPSKGLLNIHRSFEFVTVYNTGGIKVMELDVQDKAMDLSDLPSGLYILKLSDFHQNTSWTKWIKL